MDSLFPILLIAIGIAVLLLGNRLPVLGAAVGALLGLGLLYIFSGNSEPWVQLALVGGLALLGLFAAGFAKGIIDIVIRVLGALAGAAVVLGIYSLFNLDGGALMWVLVVVGAVIGFMVIGRARRGSKDWGMIILASLIGALLVTRGVEGLIPSLGDNEVIISLIALALFVLSIAYQGGVMRRNEKAAPPVQASSTTTTTPVAPQTPPTAPPASSTGDGNPPKSPGASA